MRYLFFSSIAWDFYRLQEHELPIYLSGKGNKCIYVNPLRYRDSEISSIRFRALSPKGTNGAQVIDRSTSLSRSFFSLLYETFQNQRILRRSKPDIVVSFDHLMSSVICLYCWFKNITFVYAVSEDWVEVEQRWYMKLYIRYFAEPLLGSFSQAIISQSHRQAERFRKYNRRVHIIPNGKTLDFVERCGNEIDRGRHVGKVVNFIGTLRDNYDFDMLFDVFKEFPDIELNIYGSGILENKLSAKSKYYTNIHLKGNATPDIHQQLTAQSLFGVLPLKLNKQNESTCPIKLFDYWAAGKAVIASPTYELKKLAMDGGAVFATSKQEFIDSIRLFLKDDGMMRSIGRKGYDKALRQYNYNLIGPKFESIFNSSWN